MQTTVIASPTRGKDSETDDHGCSHVALWGVSLQLSICDNVSVSHALSLPCHEDLIDTISRSNLSMLTHTQSNYTV